MFWQLILKDLKLYLSDRRSMIISLLVPIGIACFMTLISGNMGQSTADSKVPLLVAVEGPSAGAATLISNLRHAGSFDVKQVSRPEAEKSVKSGDAATALVVPADFMSGTRRPHLTLLEDPSKGVEAQIARGTLMPPLLKTVLGVQGDLKPPFDLEEQSLHGSQTPNQEAGAAHIFAGMAMQGLLFFSIEAAMGIMRERRQGIWKRLRSSPVPPWMLLAARGVSGSIRAVAVLVLIFAFGMAAFHFHVEGSWLGLGLMTVFTALMASAFGLFVAALGRNEQQSRGLSIFAVLFMLMLGGAWFPSFLMPDWVQKAAMIVPVKWAIDGFDAMTWRRESIGAIPLPLIVLLGFTILFGVIAVTRFRWEAESA